MKEIKKARIGIIAVLVLMLVSITRRLPEARRLSPGITTLALVGIVLLVAAGSASAATEMNVSSFNGGDYDANIANERYYLTADLTADADKSGIIIGADGVTIDGQGHYISGGTPGSCPGVPMLPGEKGGSWARPGIVVGDFLNAWELATIKNIEVKNFCTGILLYGADAKNERHIVENCSVHDNGNSNVEVSDANTQGIALYKKVCNCTINNNTVYNTASKLKPDCDDSGAGISLKVGSNDNDITNNTCYNNTLAGIYSKSGGGNCYNRIFNNTVYENGATGATATYTGGIRFQCKSTDWNTFENNTARDNFGPGIFIGGHHCTLRNNTATDNKNADAGNPGYGLWNDRWDGGGGGDSYTQLYDNTFCNNEGEDIHADAVGQNATGDHNTCDTGSNYQDNSASGSNICEFPCTTAKPDLEIINKSETLDGSAFTVTYTVENNGGGNAGASTTCIYVTGAQVATDPVGALAAGATHEGTVVIDPFDCPCGTDVTVMVCADNDDAVDERDETNNCLENAFNCLPCPGEPQLNTTPDPPSNDFGSVLAGETGTWTFDITNSGTGTLNWTVADDRDWITVSPGSGSDAGTVTVTINTTGLADGAYNGTLNVSSNGGTKEGIVSVTVLPDSVDPMLCTSPDPPSNDFGEVPPGKARTWTFNITNCGGEGTLNWTVTDDQDWITVSPESGSDAGMVTVTINTTGLSDGAHTGTVNVSSGYGTNAGTISVDVTGSSPQPIDLTPTALDIPDPIYVDCDHPVAATISNLGSGDASAFNVTLKADGVVVDEARVGGLSGNSDTAVGFSWRPDTTGSCTLLVEADTDGEVNETDESNNTFDATANVLENPVPPPPGAVVTIPDVSATGMITIPITIGNVSNVGSCQLTLSYDPDVVIVLNASQSNFDSLFVNLEDAASGSVSIITYQTLNPGLDGDVIVAEVTFMTVGNSSSSTPLDLEVTTLTDATPDCNPIPYTILDGSFTLSLNGDVNGDGMVDVADCMFLAKHLLGVSGFETIVEDAADVNGNGEIEVSDCMYLAKHLAGIGGFEVLK